MQNGHLLRPCKIVQKGRFAAPSLRDGAPSKFVQKGRFAAPCGRPQQICAKGAICRTLRAPPANLCKRGDLPHPAGAPAIFWKTGFCWNVRGTKLPPPPSSCLRRGDSNKRDENNSKCVFLICCIVRVYVYLSS